jgi:hypothetical protein
MKRVNKIHRDNVASQKQLSRLLKGIKTIKKEALQVLRYRRISAPYVGLFFPHKQYGYLFKRIFERTVFLEKIFGRYRLKAYKIRRHEKWKKYLKN